MKTSALCSSLLFLGLILISQSPSLANARKAGAGVNMDQICGGAMDKIGCNTLLSDPKMGSAKSYEQLSKLFLEMALAKAVEAQTILKGLALTNPSPALKECSGFDYDGLVGSFRSALGEIDEDPQTANYDAKVGGDGPATCERRLADDKLVIPQVADLNRQMSLLSEVAFLITDQLDG